MLIGLNGRLKSGKDTTFGVIQEFIPDAERVSFAAALKDSAAAALGMSPELMEQLKADEHIYFQIHNLNSLDYERYHEGYNWKMNMRQFLQRYGTEAHRDIFGSDFWVDIALPKDLDHSNKLLVVTDMRFPNEFSRVKELGGVTVKVVRETATKHNHHPSEQDMDYLIDHFLDNTGRLSELKDNTYDLLHQLGVTLPEWKYERIR